MTIEDKMLMESLWMVDAVNTNEEMQQVVLLHVATRIAKEHSLEEYNDGKQIAGEFYNNQLHALLERQEKERNKFKELIKEFAKPFDYLMVHGNVIDPNGTHKFCSLSHKELFSYINDLLQVRACKIEEKIKEQ